MRVLVTGGTGFVGSHTVAALVAAGHEVRLLVRSPDRIAPALAPHGIGGEVDHRVGDVTDAGAVEAALPGCDAVVHAAAVYNLDSRAYRATRATNVAGARTVLTAAVAHGCDPVVHVSSVDVRDVAAVHAAVLRAGAGPRAYLVPGGFLDGKTLFATLRAVTRRRLPMVTVPARPMLPVTRLATAAQRVLPFHVPAEYDRLSTCLSTCLSICLSAPGSSGSGRGCPGDMLQRHNYAPGAYHSTRGADSGYGRRGAASRVRPVRHRPGAHRRLSLGLRREG